MRIGQDSRLFNAEIRTRREALGLTQEELGQKLGYTDGQIVGQAESLKVTRPDSRSIKKLAKFFGVEPEVLCPTWLVMMDGLPKRSIQIARITKHQLEQKMAERLLAIDTQATTTPVDLDRDLLVQAVKEGMPDLSPIEEEVVCLSFGLYGSPEKPSKEIAKIKRVSRSSVRAILHRAVKKLREHKKVGKQLRYFYDAGTRRTHRLGHVLGDPDNKTSFFLPEGGTI